MIVRRSNPVMRLDEAILNGVFQPIVDRLGFDPGPAVRMLVLLHVLLTASMYAAVVALSAAGNPAVSPFETSIGVPAYGLLEIGCLIACIHLKEYALIDPIISSTRVLAASAALTMTLLLPRVFFGTAPDEYLDASGHTPFAMRQALGSYVFSRWTLTAILYIVICRKPPPRRRTAYA